MNFKRISISEAQEMLNQGPCTIADIRDPASYQQGHMPKAIALSNDNIQTFITEQDKSQPLLVCCYHGNSSQQAASYLAEQGFDAYSIDGGFEAWKLSGQIEA